MNKYYFDWFNENVLARGGRGLGALLWNVGDETRHRRRAGQRQRADSSGSWPVVARGLQTGYLYHYAFAMIIGLAALVGWLVLRA